MKKLIRAAALVLASAAAVCAFAYASGQDTVISLSYLNGTYAAQLTTTLKMALSGLDSVYQTALAKLNGQSGQNDPSWTSSDTMRMLYPQAGETVTLSAGSGLLWTSGSGSASALLLDVTAGKEVPAGDALTAGHRYLAEEETVIAARSASACGAEGMWKTTATGSAPVESPFDDVDSGAWYFDSVMYVVEKGLFKGTEGNNFSPTMNMNRAMLVTVLYRLAGQPAVSGGAAFNDVSSSAWYSDAVTWAAQTGIVTGTGGNQFSPDLPVSREQIAVMLRRYAAYYGYDVSGAADLSGYADGGSVSGFAREGVSWAVAEGLLQGGDGKLSPTSNATRAEVATLLQRYAAWLSN